MSKTTIPSGGIAADIIDATKIADDAISEEHLDASAITGFTALGAAPADTDELLISDAGTLKRIDYSYIKAANTPAFEAHMSANQELTDNAATKLSFNTENLDTDSTYDNSSNYRFTPAVSGKYYVFAMANFDAQATNVHRSANLYIYKNGQIHKTGYFDNYDNDTWYAISPYVATIMDLDSDDYVEVYAKFDTDGSSSRRMTAGQYTTFGAYKIIGA